MGRLKTNKRNGKAELKTDCEYNVRSWTKSITHPLFSQKLYYNDERESGTLNTPTLQREYLRDGLGGRQRLFRDIDKWDKENIGLTTLKKRINLLSVA